MKKNITLFFILLSCLVFAKVSAQDLPPASLILKTDLKTGERITIRLAANPADVIIDWGDGAFAEIKVKTAFDSTPTSVGYTLTVDNPTIRIWGRLVNLHAHTSKLTSVELGGNQWDLIRRIDFQNNLLTSLVFPADGGFKTSLGTIHAYNNNIVDVCAIEALYRSLPDRTSITNTGSLVLTGNSSTVEGEGNVLQNEAVKLHSRISLANALNYNVADSEKALSDPDYVIKENPTAKGCESTGITKLQNSDYACFYNSSENILTVHNKQHKTGSLIVYNSIGNVCYQSIIKGNDAIISTSHLEKGMYLVKLEDFIQKVLIY